jgi:hypothetical protein
MKKFFIFSAAALFCLSSCGKKDSAGMSDRAKKNLEATHTVTKAFETGDVSGIDGAVAEDFVDHTNMGDKNRDSLKAAIVMMHKSDSTMSMETIQEFASDDYAMTWYTFKGTSDGSMGMPAGPYSMKAIEVVKFNKDSKAIEHWEYLEPSEMMKMMGGQKDSNMGTPKDTTTHM